MDNNVSTCLVARYEQLEKSIFCEVLAIKFALALGALIFLCVLIWSLNIPDYVKYFGTIPLVIIILLLAFYVGKFIFM